MLALESNIAHVYDFSIKNSCKVLIEQKSLNVNLDTRQKQSDGAMLTPMEQAQRYVLGLKLSEHPRFIVVCNFAVFQIYDTETQATEVLQLADLPKEYYRLSFLVDEGNAHLKREMELSIKAGEIVGLLYDEILKHYHNPEAEFTLKSLNMLCVRLVFCLYAEDAGIFGRKNQFHDYLSQFEPRFLRQALIDLFKVLDTKPEERDRYMDVELAAFPYVNGGLFADENIEIPQFDERVKSLLLAKASDDFDWSEISPTIFGAVFESTLNPETRRSGGMHYTSIENIHKVIDPLFLNDLKAEFAEICEIKVAGTRQKRLLAFQDKLADLTFLDPACGSGNFLTETYLSLRRLENEILKILFGNQIVMDLGDVIKVSIGQFYGIEINDFAVTVAKTALWIAESQMMKATEEIVHNDLDFLPLKSYANITDGNALRLNWEDVVPKEKLNYIMGNPPFVGKKEQSKEQKNDLFSLFGSNSFCGNLDYVAGWYIKAAQFMQNTDIRAAYVSTNSITQGEQVYLLWNILLNVWRININFAYRTFKWSSEAKEKAAVHCVIIGFSAKSNSNKQIYFNNTVIYPKNINPYLIDAPNILISARKSSLCMMPNIITGNQATDDGNFFLTTDEYSDFVNKEPHALKYIRKAFNSQGFINNKFQYCLWLVGISPVELKKMPLVLQRIEAIRNYRLASSKENTRRQAEIPWLFTENRQPQTNYIVIPKVSSENRRYIPLGFLPPDVICNNTIKLVPEATLYHFGVLCSNVHNAWMRAVAGRLKSDYQYSNTIVYNNFPWCNPIGTQKTHIEQTAQAILAARTLYPDCSLADLYDETTMPPELRKAHKANDKAVMKAYGFTPPDKRSRNRS